MDIFDLLLVTSFNELLHVTFHSLLKIIVMVKMHAEFQRAYICDCADFSNLFRLRLLLFDYY